jgi:hypothetical protein
MEKSELKKSVSSQVSLNETAPASQVGEAAQAINNGTIEFKVVSELKNDSFDQDTNLTSELIEEIKKAVSQINKTEKTNLTKAFDLSEFSLNMSNKSVGFRFILNRLKFQICRLKNATHQRQFANNDQTVNHTVSEKRPLTNEVTNQSVKFVQINENSNAVSWKVYDYSISRANKSAGFGFLLELFSHRPRFCYLKNLTKKVLVTNENNSTADSSELGLNKNDSSFNKSTEAVNIFNDEKLLSLNNEKPVLADLGREHFVLNELNKLAEPTERVNMDSIGSLEHELKPTESIVLENTETDSPKEPAIISNETKNDVKKEIAEGKDGQNLELGTLGDKMDKKLEAKTDINQTYLVQVNESRNSNSDGNNPGLSNEKVLDKKANETVKEQEIIQAMTDSNPTTDREKVSSNNETLITSPVLKSQELADSVKLKIEKLPEVKKQVVTEPVKCTQKFQSGKNCSKKRSSLNYGTEFRKNTYFHGIFSLFFPNTEWWNSFCEMQQKTEFCRKKLSNLKTELYF